MFYGQRLVDIPDGKPKWSGMEKTSDLGWDSPKEAIEKRKKEKKEEEGEKEAKEKKDEHTDKKQKSNM